MSLHLSRRRALGLSVSVGAALLGFAGGVRAKPEPIEIKWADLIPDDADKPLIALEQLGLVEHGAIPLGAPQSAAPAPVTTEYNGKSVKIAGFVLPLSFDDGSIKEFILVPYIGACIHVPPPPANQLIIVYLAEPYTPSEVFEPIYAIGELGTTPRSTELAEIGYTLEATALEKYDKPWW